MRALCFGGWETRRRFEPTVRLRSSGTIATKARAARRSPARSAGSRTGMCAQACRSSRPWRDTPFGIPASPDSRSRCLTAAAQRANRPSLPATSSSGARCPTRRLQAGLDPNLRFACDRQERLQWRRAQSARRNPDDAGVAHTHARRLPGLPSHQEQALAAMQALVLRCVTPKPRSTPVNFC